MPSGEFKAIYIERVAQTLLTSNRRYLRIWNNTVPFSFPSMTHNPIEPTVDRIGMKKGARKRVDL